MKRNIIFLSLISSLVFLPGCLLEDNLKQPYMGFSPFDINDGWEVSVPSAENIDSLALDLVYKQLYADDDFWMTKSLLVFRNGKIVAESYLKTSQDRMKTDAVWSCTKQVNAIITGIAIHEGKIARIDDPIEKYLPDYIARYPDKAGITIENLLMMKGGIDFDNGYQSDVFRMHKTDNSLDYVLGLGLRSEPGTDFWYNDGEPQLMSGIVQAATGVPMDEYARTVFFDKIGMTNYDWVRYSDGVTMGGFGILTTPRELAKIARCVLDSGRVGEVQVIPEEWVLEMTSAKTEVDDLHSFGYYWWSIPDKGYIHMWGHGGQYAFIIPEKKMLVVMTSLSQVDDDVNVPVGKVVDLVDRIAETAE